MKTPPPRTNATVLTDDDLLLYDFLTKGQIPIEAFRREAYRFHMNCGYTHGLSDEELIERVGQLSELGLLKTVPSHSATAVRRARLAENCELFPHMSVTFTKAGAHLWEQERSPNYATKLFWLKGTTHRRIRIAACERRLLEDFIRVNNETGRLRVHQPFRFKSHKSLRLPIYFGHRVFNDVMTATASCEFPSPDELQTGWDTRAYERCRTWWISIFEPVPGSNQ